ncbi:uncharacterized protein LAESUDRAFT_759641 [Laetiporus sulphureus 93-53]|uniref:Uncharacterized protein n=1 Tax=Laetiporus sulphureus 93-53 TaxID=1314785 RepID=A0A165E2B9_9APHY|nr:uncharacterized protein LAESUDRAFT_759641 [Laetiporus sulphureus 93-53]KZT06109.1 hypothetical protein LAESUDRAFT_759641 [Laetiporus sulphureus 93-53]
MLQTLDTVPGLEVLSLKSDPFSLNDNQQEEEEEEDSREDHILVSLPRLQLLRFLYVDMSHVASLIDHISFLSQTSIEWTCRYMFSNEEPFTALVAKLFTRAQRKAFVKFRTSTRNERWAERLLTKQAGEEETRSADVRAMSLPTRHDLRYQLIS